MQKVKLTTEGGREVADVETPPFQVPPGGIWWGERSFVLKSAARTPWVYEEIFMHVLPHPAIETHDDFINSVT